MEPAYLDSAEVASVKIDSTSALTVVCINSADRYLPMRHLSRVVVMGDVQWSTEALSACMRAEVPILFMSRRGVMLGVCSTLVQRKHQMNKMVAKLLALPDARDRLDNWTRSQQARQRWLFSKACAFQLNDLPPVQANTTALDLLSMHIKFDAARLEKLVQNHLRAALYEWLADHGFTHDILQGHDVRLPLIDSYQQSLLWYMRKIMYQNPPDVALLNDNLIHGGTYWFHKHSDTTRKHVLKLHNSLSSWCVGEIVN